MQDRLRELLKTRLDTKSSAQQSLTGFIKNTTFVEKGSIGKVLDLGCGEGSAFSFLDSQFPNLEYFGLDIESSAEVERRTRDDLNFSTYDGKTFPFEANFFDAIFCRQVLEHVRYPDAVVAEAARVLKPGGFFFGSVSQLEPYHSHSIFNWTPLGIIEVFRSHGMDVKRIAPGIDGVTITLRRVLGHEFFQAFFTKESILNYFIEMRMAFDNRAEFNRSYMKLVCAGHIIFLAQLDEEQ